MLKPILTKTFFPVIFSRDFSLFVDFICVWFFLFFFIGILETRGGDVTSHNINVRKVSFVQDWEGGEGCCRSQT